MGKITRQELSPGLEDELNKSGNLSTLATTDKSSLVGAVNEIGNLLGGYKIEKDGTDGAGIINFKTV